jgi:hypothetical protein
MKKALSATAQAATQLVAEEESRRPPKGTIAADRRGIMRGPKVEFISPKAAVHSPLRLLLKFEAFGGATINPDSVKVLYLRTPNVDLTPRVKPFIQAGGIDLPDAELPAGEYTMRVDVKIPVNPDELSVLSIRKSPGRACLRRLLARRSHTLHVDRRARRTPSRAGTSTR